MHEKIELRRLAKVVFSKLDPTVVAEKNAKLGENIKKVLDELSPELVGVFAPLSDEPNWAEGFDVNNLKLAYPRIKGEGVMDFAAASPEQLSLQDTSGISIKQPDFDLPAVVPTVLLVPALAFDRKGDRLGRGRGFYDRYLENFKGKIIGITFNETLFPNIPVEEHDKKMEVLITDKEIIKID